MRMQLGNLEIDPGSQILILEDKNRWNVVEGIIKYRRKVIFQKIYMVQQQNCLQVTLDIIADSLHKLTYFTSLGHVKPTLASTARWSAKSQGPKVFRDKAASFPDNSHKQTAGTMTPHYPASRNKFFPEIFCPPSCKITKLIRKGE